MDTSYLLTALRSIRDERTNTHHTPDTRPPGYQEALEWAIEHIDKNFYHFEDILDNERN